LQANDTPAASGKPPAPHELRIIVGGVVDPHNARERLSNALESLVDTEPIRDRLQTAAITLLPLRVEDFPEGEPRELYEQIRADLEKVSGTPDQGHIEATIRAMDDEQAVRVARRVVRLFYLVAFPTETV
jgi:hypothetical protein